MRLLEMGDISQVLTALATLSYTNQDEYMMMCACIIAFRADILEVDWDKLDDEVFAMVNQEFMNTLRGDPVPAAVRYGKVLAYRLGLEKDPPVVCDTSLIEEFRHPVVPPL